jgi:hypothetical protein
MMRNGRGLGVIPIKSDKLCMVGWVKRNITRQEREDMRNGKYLTGGSDDR